MKHILVLGAGKSSPSLIRYLLENAEANDWFVTVGDYNQDAAKERVADHPKGTAIFFDVTDPSMVEHQVKNADVVVNFLAPRFQYQVAYECVQHGVHMVSASYRSKEIRELDTTAKREGVLILNETGLDPGIDLMSAQEIISRVRSEGGIIRKFVSYGSGLPANDEDPNPFEYVITWNPYNVVVAGGNGAQYLEDGKIKILPYHQVFRQTWPVDVDDIGTLEAYPNRDSLAYKDLFGLQHAVTMIRGTLRNPTFAESWLPIINLGLTNDELTIPELHERSMREIVEMCLPPHVNGSDIKLRVANYLRINATGYTMKKLEWLGLFDEEKCGCTGKTPADAMVHLISKKLALPDNGRDMVILVHKMLVDYPDAAKPRPSEKIISTMIKYGDAGGETAMSKTVGLPAAIAVKLILTDQLKLTGSHIPIHAAIYTPILKELEGLDIKFVERTEAVEEMKK
ncbi:saccharopine dehydrogenase NADP-binding domain-containing protein [bacterium]|nr:saccharopine dehydrogenase NADP-binding domain-containing protein [bacterium]